MQQSLPLVWERFQLTPKGIAYLRRARRLSAVRAMKRPKGGTTDDKP